MRIFVTGATGLIGRRIVLDRLERGDRVVVLSRSAERAEQVFAASANSNITVVEGDPATPGPWQEAMDGCDAVVHLAGASIAGKRWTPAYKQVLVNSRVDSTHQVVEACRRAATPPRALVCASAVGWYGDTGDTPTDESAPPAQDFLAELTQRWEGEAEQAAALGVRPVMLRIGALLDPRGGLLEGLARPFRMFVGGPIGRGRAYVPWIHWRDLVGLVDLALTRDDVEGPMNATAPNPVRNKEFSRALGRALHRPSLLPIPPIALRLVLGELGRFATMSQRIVPAKALAAGYTFIHTEIGPALASLYEPSAPSRVRSGFVMTPAARAPRRSALAPNPAAIRLVVLGADAPALGRGGRLSATVVRACGAARRAGRTIVVASGRPPRALAPLARALGADGPIIAYYGAVTWQDGAATRTEALDAATAREVAATARDVDADVAIAVEVVDRWYTDRLAPELVAVRPNVAPDGTAPIDALLVRPVSQVDLLGAPASIAAIHEALRRGAWGEGRVTVQRTGATMLHVGPPRVDQAMALQRIAASMQCPAAAVLAIGVAPNDAGMLEWAGSAVATASAGDTACDLADVVIGDDEVGRAILRYAVPGSSDIASDAAETG